MKKKLLKNLISITLMLVISLSVFSFAPHSRADNDSYLMTAKDFAEKCREIATEYKTLYVMGGWGAPMNESNKKRYIEGYTYNNDPERAAKINAADGETFGFDCVCLIKGILWGWSGDTGAANGGAKYASNGVADMTINSMLSLCGGGSDDFSEIEVGEILFCSRSDNGIYGHVGIYIGNGLAVESTPSWDDCVQITAVENMGYQQGQNNREWLLHGKLSQFLLYESDMEGGACLPIKGGSITAPYSTDSTNGKEPHYGIDITPRKNNIVYSAFDGTVEYIKNECTHVNLKDGCEHNGTFGNSICIKNEDGTYYAIYGHLKYNSILVEPGQSVKVGEPIATVGSSGKSSSPHLHFEVRTDIDDQLSAVNVNDGGDGVIEYSPYKHQTPKGDKIEKDDYIISSEGYAIYLVNDENNLSGSIGSSNLSIDERFELEICIDENAYRIRLLSSKSKGALGCLWNENSVYTEDGNEVVLSRYMGRDHQKWLFEKCGDGYLIHPADTLGFSLTRSDEKLTVSKTTGAENQIWSLESTSEACYHQYEFAKNLKPATCRKNGRDLYVCSSCKDEVTLLTELGGHTFGDWTAETSSDSETVEVRTCIHCDATETREHTAPPVTENSAENSTENSHDLKIIIIICASSLGALIVIAVILTVVTKKKKKK